MQHKYFPHTSEDLRQMLEVIGVERLEDLFAEVPEELKLHRELDIPSAQSELEVRRTVDELATNVKPLVCFAGAGAYDHYQPSVIPYITARSEFSTSYTPYQAEISQGTLQYIFEYQSMMAELTGMDISNASMYDGATVTAEAMMMCVHSARKKNAVVISATFAEEVLRVVRTYAHFHGVELVEIAAKDGKTDLEAIRERLSAGDVAGVIVPQPNRFGIIEDFTGLADACHAEKALLVINTVASALGVLRTPGEWGADIACGDAQSLGFPLAYGGPYCGYLCVKKEHVRKMPGRLVGATLDADGKRCFVLTMQAREQHIRREKATSNICTAQGIMCLYVALYLSLMGNKGLREVNEQSYAKAHYLCDALVGTGKAERVYDSPFLNEFLVRINDRDTFFEHAVAAGILPGVKVGDDKLLIAVTEKRMKEEMDALVEILNK
ncbi:MAG: aminomethyl-transferring glycine dehydrogenase subunit GcvPA [Alloprevotella sp.]|nr:aminomethyl-transferring glycine dehydrogenase subunit GcvPA [Alloprevotella sp.]